jgi:hypothetical protein
MDEVSHKGNSDIHHHLHKKNGNAHEDSVFKFVRDRDGRAAALSASLKIVFSLKMPFFASSRLLGVFSVPCPSFSSVFFEECYPVFTASSVTALLEMVALILPAHNRQFLS